MFAEAHLNRRYILLLISFIAASNSVYFFLSPEHVCLLGIEDGFFEYLTALFFMTASILFFLSSLKNKNIWFLLLASIFFFGFGEEISWGQRIFGFETPEYFLKENVQKEFSFHNLETFNSRNHDKSYKDGISKLLTINFLFLLFSISYGFVLPLGLRFSKFLRSLNNKLKIPVPPITIGVFFLINWVTFKFILTALIPMQGNDIQYLDTKTEIYECVASFIFFMIGFYFYKASCPFIFINGKMPYKKYYQPIHTQKS